MVMVRQVCELLKGLKESLLSDHMNSSAATPLLTIIVLVKNNISILNSIRSQLAFLPDGNFEILVLGLYRVNNIVLPEEFKNDFRIRVLNPKQLVKNYVHALNYALAEVKGEYLTWVRDDYDFEPGAIKLMLESVMASGKSFVYANYRQMDPGRNYSIPMRLGKRPSVYEWNFIGHCFLLKTRLLQMTGGFNLKFDCAAEYQWWRKIFHSSQVGYLDIFLLTCLRLRHWVSLEERFKMPVLGTLVALSFRPLRWARMLRVFEFLSEEIAAANLDEGRVVLFMKELFLIIRRFSLLTWGICKFFWKIILFKNSRTRKKEALDIALRTNFIIGEEQRKKILCIVPEIVLGGSEKVLRDIVEGLQGDQVDFYLFSSEKDDNEWCRSFRKLFKGEVLLRKDEMFSERLYHQFLKATIQKIDPGIVLFTNSEITYRLLPQLKKLFSEIRFMDIVHIEDFVASTKEYIPLAPFIKRRICISHKLRERLIEKYREADLPRELEQRLITIHNGNDMVLFSRDKNSRTDVFRRQHNIPLDAQVISFVGRLSEEKRPELFVDIMANLCQVMGNFPLAFIMAGDGDEEQNVREKIKTKGLNDKFFMVGTLKKLEVKSLLAESTMLILTSRVEGIPLVMVEAMAMQLPVIVPRVGAVEEVIQHKENGFVVSSDPDAMNQEVVEIAKKLLTQAHWREDIGHKARISVQHEFSLEKMVDRYRDELLGEASTRLGPLAQLKEATNVIDSPEISIVLPTYNGLSKGLKRSIDSCLAQTFTNFELIIVDDCSDEEIYELVRSYGDNRVRYLRNFRNLRLPRSLNVGFSYARGKYLTWTSDDNFYDPQALKKMLDYLRETSGEFVYADYFEFRNEKLDQATRIYLADPSKLKEINCVMGCFLYSRKVMDLVGVYDPEMEIIEDYDYWTRVAEKFTLLHLKEPLYYYQYHEKSLTTQKELEARISFFLFRTKNGEYKPKDWIWIFRYLALEKKTGITKRVLLPFVYVDSIYSRGPKLVSEVNDYIASKGAFKKVVARLKNIMQ